MKFSITVDNFSWLTEHGDLIIQILWLLIPLLGLCAVLYMLHVLASHLKKGG